MGCLDCGLIIRIVGLRLVMLTDYGCCDLDLPLVSYLCYFGVISYFGVGMFAITLTSWVYLRLA